MRQPPLEVCRSVNLGDHYSQQALNTCLGEENTLTAAQASANESLRGQSQRFEKAQQQQSTRTLATANRLIQQLNSLSRSRFTQLKNLGNSMENILQSNQILLDTTQKMVQITKNIYQALPQMVPTDQSQAKDAIKNSWFISNSAMKEYLAGLETLAQAKAAFQHHYQNLPQDPTFLNPNEIR